MPWFTQNEPRHSLVMKRVFSLYHILWWIGGLVGFHLLPHVVSSFYNAATTVDDYCFADTVRTYGLGNAIYFYYTQVNGRYTGIVFSHALNSMSWESQLAYQLMPLLCILGLGWMIFKVLSLYTRWPIWATALASAGIWVVFLDTLPSLSEGIYWLSSLYVHGVSWITFLMVVYFLGKLPESPRYAWGVVGSIFIAGGISEATYLNTFLVVFAWGLWTLLTDRKITYAMLVIGITATVCLLQIKFSPANLGRQSEDVSSIQLEVVIDSLVHFIRLLRSQWTWSLTILSIILTMIGAQYETNHRVFNVHLGYAFGVLTVISAAPYLVASLGIGGVPPRVLNVTYFFLLLSWVYVVIRFGRLVPSYSFPEYAWCMAIVLLGFFTLQHNTRAMYRDWYRGEYSGYRMEVADRINRLKSDAVWVSIEPFQHRPHSIFFSEMDKNTNGLWAKCLSQYYKKPIQFIEN